MKKIVVIDDDIDICLLLDKFLRRHGYEVFEANNGKKGLQLIDEKDPDLVMCDFRLDDFTGAEILEKIKEKHHSTPVIIMTGYSDIKIAVQVMKAGAFDYVTKPLFPEEILLTIRKALEQGAPVIATPVSSTSNSTPAASKSMTAAAKLGKGSEKLGGNYISGTSENFRNILKQIERVAPTDFSVIIYGESGSGKEVIAHEIHNRSKRKSKPFVAIDCGALSKELAASELFGHEKGSFTGAIGQKPGSFELANGGTIFLDEIANLSYDIQVSLLRVVQERKMRRVGGTKDIELDVRIIVASNEKLWDAAKNGKFREDLYHRFNEFSIDVPPLRKRKEDIMTFARHFFEITKDELGKDTLQNFSPEVEHIFKNYVWHGNLRELRNVVKRAVLLSDGEFIESTTLPFEITNYSKLKFDEEEEQEVVAVQESEEAKANRVNRDPIDIKAASIDAEYEAIVEALKRTNFNKSKAAKILNIDRKTLYNKMKEYNELNKL